jgi:uncharacterized membrane protein YGL010W
MKTLVDQLSNYAKYHRDRRNIATHFVGIPMIVMGIDALLARPSIEVIGWSITPALLVTIVTVGYYLALDRRLGVVMGAALSLTLCVGSVVASQSLGLWLLGSGVLFIGGWIIQFIGHAFEGKKPAFADDLVGLVIGPLFVVAEAGFAFGLRSELREDIERIAGPTRARTVAASSPTV